MDSSSRYQLSHKSESKFGEMPTDVLVEGISSAQSITSFSPDNERIVEDLQPGGLLSRINTKKTAELLAKDHGKNKADLEKELIAAQKALAASVLKEEKFSRLKQSIDREENSE